MCGAEPSAWAVATQVSQVEIGRSSHSEASTRRSEGKGVGWRTVEREGERGIQKTVRLETSWEGLPAVERGKWVPRRGEYGVKGSL